jgi:bifunctional non-homologous end joining protein LigD
VQPKNIGTKALFPSFIEPVLAEQVDRVRAASVWVHEIKFDGYRAQLHIANHDIKVFTRRGHDWTNRFKKIAVDAHLIDAESAIIDGEIVVPAADGTTDFSVLQNELKGKSTKIVMVAFDLLYLNGYDLRKLPLVERKQHLKKLIAKTDIRSARAVISTASRCTSTPARSVSKVSSPRCGIADTAQAGATTGSRRPVPSGRRRSSRALLSTRTIGMASISAAAGARTTWSTRARSTMASTRPRRRSCEGTWVEPKLLAEVEYRAKSAEGKVRHPFFKGLRENL